MVPKCHHVMKLYKRVPCGHCEYTTKGKALGCIACHHTGYVYEEVDLLASFEGELEIRTKGSAYGRVVARRIDDIATLRTIWTKNPNVHVLILERK